MYTSVGSAHRKTGIPHFDNKARVEDTIRAAGFPSYVIFRPVFFMENLTSPWFLNGDTIYAAMRPDLKLQMIAVDDIGKYVARGFTNADKLNRREIDLAGDEATMPDVAMALSSGLGRNISFVQIPISEVRKNSDDFATMLDGSSGWATTSTSRRSNASSASRARGWSSGLCGRLESRRSKVESRKSMSPEVAQLVADLDQAYNKPSWHGTNLRGSVRRVTPAQAAWRPAPAASQHLGNRRPCGLLEIRVGAPLHRRRARIFCDERVELVPPPGAGQENSDAAWRADLELMDETHETFRAAVAAALGERPRSDPARQESQQFRVVSGIAAHDLYHAGQIQLLKRLAPR